MPIPKSVHPLSLEALDRIRAKSVEQGDCWIWTGGQNQSGYGVIALGFNRDSSRRPHRVHRTAYQILVCELPDHLQLDHLCRIRACWNPSHLEPVTRKVNILRGTSPAARQAAQTRCNRGHEFAPENTYVTPRGRRQCRACATLRGRKRRTGAPLPPIDSELAVS